MQVLNPLSPQPPAPTPSVTTVENIKQPPSTQDPAVKPRARRRMVSDLLLQPPVLVTLGMLAFGAEAILWATTSPWTFAAVNAGLVALVFIASLAWRRRGTGGVLGWLFGGRRSRPGKGGGRPASAARPGGGLLGRLVRPGGKGGGLLSRLRAGKPGLMSRLRQRRTNRRNGPGGGGTPSGPGHKPLSRLGRLNPFRRSRTPGGGKPGGSAPGQRPPGSKGSKSRKKWKPGKVLKDFARGVREGSKRKDGKKTDKPERPSKEAAETSTVSQADAAPPAEREHPPKAPAPKQRQNTKEPTVAVQYNEDASLQRWGRNLVTIAPALEESAKSAEGHAEVAEQLLAGLRRLAAQGDGDLPASKALVAEVESIASDLSTILADNPARRLRSLAARAEALGMQYRVDHEVDEARLAGERGGRHKERRADVASAEQDT